MSGIGSRFRISSIITSDRGRKRSEHQEQHAHSTHRVTEASKGRVFTGNSEDEGEWSTAYLEESTGDKNGKVQWVTHVSQDESQETGDEMEFCVRAE